MPKVSEIWAELGFKFEKTTLGDFIGAVRDLDLSVVASAIGVGGLFAAMKSITVEAVNSATQLRLFNLATGIPEENVQRWTQLAEKVGLTKETMMSVIQAQRNIGGPAFDVEKSLRQASEAIRGRSKAEADIILQARNMSSIHAVLALKDMNEQWQQMTVVTDKQTAANANLGESYRGLKNAVTTSLGQFVAIYAESISNINNDLRKLITDPEFMNLFFGEVKESTLGPMFRTINEYKNKYMASQVKAKYYDTYMDPYMSLAGIGQSQSTSSSTFNITVHGVDSNPHAVAEAVHQELKKQIQAAEHQSRK